MAFIQGRSLDCAKFLGSGTAMTPVKKPNTRLKVPGGTTTIQTLSNKTVVKTNKYLEHKDLSDLSPGERALAWRIARTGEDAMQVRALLMDFTSTVAMAREAMVDKRKNQSGGKSFFQTFGLRQLKDTVRQAVAPTNEVNLSVEE
jgi:hypothetical protein